MNMNVLNWYPRPPVRQMVAALATALAVGANAQALMTAPAAGVSVDTQDVQAALAHLPPTTRQQALGRPQTLAVHAQELLARRLLARQAEAAGLDRDPQVQARLRLARERVLAEVRLEMLETELNDPARMEAYALSQYRAQPERFRATDRVRARHILLAAAPDAQERAQRLLEQLRGGADFARLAAEHSIDTASRERGGDLGFFDPQAMAPEFRDAVQALGRPGELAGPVRTSFGWHIIRFEEKRAAGIAPFDEVREHLIAESRGRLVQERRQAIVAELMRDAHVDEAAVRAAAEAAGTPAAR